MRKVVLSLATSSVVAFGLLACGMSGCSSTSSDSTAAATPELQGTYVNHSGDGDIASISFTTDGKFIESLATCADGEDNAYDSDNSPPTNRASACIVSGTYAYDAKAATISLKDGTTGAVTTLPFVVTETGQDILDTTTTTSLAPLDLVTSDAGASLTDGGSLVSDAGALLHQCAGATSDGGGATILVVKSATIGGTSFSAGGSVASTANPGGGTINSTVDAKYSIGSGWTTVYNAVYKKISMDTSPCATFMSTALHTFGGIDYPGSFGSNIAPTSFPVDPQKTSGIDRIVTPQVAPIKGALFQLQANTSGLSTFLMQQGWNIVWSADNLRPGDVVFVVPADQARHPAHTYMFHAWVDQCAGYAYVIDNEADAYCDPTDPGFYGYCGADGSGTVLCCKAAGTRMYKRNIKVTTPEPKDMDEQDEKMWFALRSPN